MAAHKEGKVETYFKEQVEQHGGLTRKARWLCRRGCPDQFWAFPSKSEKAAGAGSYEGKVVLMIRAAKSGFAEIKNDTPLSPHQDREIRRLRAAGVEVVVLSSFEDVDYFIRSHT